MIPTKQPAQRRYPERDKKEDQRPGTRRPGDCLDRIGTEITRVCVPPQQNQRNQQNQAQNEQQKTPEQREAERFQKEAGMPKERAMQLLDALQQNEKAEQKKLLMERRAQKRGGKDW